MNYQTLLALFIVLISLSSCDETENDEIISNLEFKNCLFLDGINDYGVISYNEDIDFTDELTLEAKIYIESFSGLQKSPWRWDESPETILPIISQSHMNSSVGDFTLAVTPTRALFAFETVDSRYSVNFTFEEKTWYHIAVTHTLGKGSEIKYYVNGEVITGEWGGDNGETIDGNDLSVPNNQQPYWIGTNNNHADAGMFKGYIDDIAVWHTIRTSSEIASTQNAEIDITQTDLICYWNFNSVNDNSVPDLKGDNNILLLYGATVETE